MISGELPYVKLLLEWGVVIIVLIDFENYAGISLMTRWSYLSIPWAIGTSSCSLMCRDFINDQMVIPINSFGDWNKFMLINENLQNEIDIYLMSIRNEISAQKTHNSWNFFINLTFGIECNISHKTACQYLHTHYKATLKGQYADGHERADVMFY